MKEVDRIVRGPPGASKQDVQKLEKALKELETPSSLLAGIGAAIGKQTAFDQHFVSEACKLIQDKMANLDAELAKFSETVTEYAKKTVALRSNVDQLASDFTERDTELLAAQKKRKDCVVAIKEAERQKKQADVSLKKATQHRDVKEAAASVGADAETQYKFLLERTGATTTEAPEVEAS